MSMKKSINDASHGRGLMNETVKIGSYEDDDYHGNEKSSSFSQLLKFIASKLRILPSSNPFGIPTRSILNHASCIRYPVSRNSRIHTQTYVPSF